jgi:hypothetical protein
MQPAQGQHTDCVQRAHCTCPLFQGGSQSWLGSQRMHAPTTRSKGDKTCLAAAWWAAEVSMKQTLSDSSLLTHWQTTLAATGQARKQPLQRYRAPLHCWAQSLPFGGTTHLGVLPTNRCHCCCKL